MSCPAPPPVPALDSTYGVLLISSALTMALWGAGTVQLYFYYDKYWAVDQRWLKLLVCSVWCLDTAHQAFIMHSTYSRLVTKFGDIVVLTEMDSSVSATVILTGFTCAFSQALFIMRIWRLSKNNRFLTGTLISFTVAEVAVFIAYYIKTKKFTEAIQLETIFGLQCSMGVITVFTDVLIAIALVYLLHRNRTTFKKSNTIINRIIVFTVNSSVITSLLAIGSLITWLAWPDTYLYLLFYFLLSRMYMNSMLASLNSRQSLRGGLSEDSYHGISIPDSRARTYPVDMSTGSRDPPASSHAVDIKVDTVIELDSTTYDSDVGATCSDYRSDYGLGTKSTSAVEEHQTVQQPG
ncbi:hypothetical protein M0805_002023 [Coniferiporia weirii]|nr:hypothetical protein M0805_002023 [Coniferiporia weirii]